MDIQQIIANLKDSFGDKINVAAITEKLKGVDSGSFSMTEIVAKLKGDGLLGDLDGDGVQESAFEEIKGKLGNMFHK